MDEDQGLAGRPVGEDDRDAAGWVRRFLADLAVVRSSNTVRAYRQDLTRWLDFCAAEGISPLAAHPRHAIAFLRAERQRTLRGGGTVSARTLVRRLTAIRQWYAFLLVEPERTGVRRNPVPGGSALRTATGVLAGQPALLRYDRPQPEVLSAGEIDRFVAHLTRTRYRDRALVALLQDAGLRIHEALGLRLGDIAWPTRTLTVRAGKTRTTRTVVVSRDALILLGAYVRAERPKVLAHDLVFVNLGRRAFGQPFGYRAWVAVCEQARRAAGTPRVHAHAFRHTCATNLAEARMPLDTLRRLLGHRSIETTLIYDGVRDGRVRREYDEAMAVLEADRRLQHRQAEHREPGA